MRTLHLMISCSLASCGVDATMDPAADPGSTATPKLVTGTWSTTPTPGVGVAGNPAALNAVGATSASDAWAFGQQPVLTQGGSSIPLVEHWNGTAWSIVSTPAISGSIVATLSSGVALASSNAWAVGYVTTAETTFGTALVEHWDGTAWKLSAHPMPALGSRLHAISATSATDVWAVGEEYLTTGGQYRTLVFHYNGSTWKASSPYLGTSFSTLYSVKAVAANDVWALGSDFNTPIALHWNGTAWKSVVFPIQTNPPTDASFAQSIDGAASNDLWAMGHNLQPAGYEGGETAYAQAWHWDGTQWTIATINSEISGGSSVFSGVTALASDDVWALGAAGGFYAGQQVVIHYDGTKWTQVTSPATGNYFPGLSVLGSNSAGDAWAVGTTDYTFSTFTMHYTP